MTTKAKVFLGMTFPQWKTAFIVFTLASMLGITTYVNDLFGLKIKGVEASAQGPVPSHEHREQKQQLRSLNDNQIMLKTRQEMVLRQLDKQDEKLDRVLEAVRENR